MSDEFSDDNAAEKFATIRPLPPLRIHHFMLWTVVAALMLTVYKTEVNTNQFSLSIGMGGVPSILVYSLCLTGLFLGLYWKRKGLIFFDEPGQKAFVLHGMFAIHYVIIAAAASYNGTASDSPPISGLAFIFPVLGTIFVSLVQLVLYFGYAKEFRHQVIWGKFFYAVGMLTILQYSLSFLGTLALLQFGPGNFRSMTFAFLVVPVAVGLIEIFYWFLAVRDDYREGTSYHWTHWLGAATWPAFRVIQASTLVLVWLFMREW